MAQVHELIRQGGPYPTAPARLSIVHYAPRPARSPPARRRTLGLLVHQIRYEQLTSWRNSLSAIFTFLFPVVFVAIIGALSGGARKRSTCATGSGDPRQRLRLGLIRIRRGAVGGE